MDTVCFVFELCDYCLQLSELFNDLLLHVALLASLLVGEVSIEAVSKHLGVFFEEAEDIFHALISLI